MELDFENLGSFEEDPEIRGLFDSTGPGSVTPGFFPLLVETPAGERKQLEVHPEATVGEIKSMVHSLAAEDEKDKDDGGQYDILFGNNSLGDDEDPLFQTTVIDTYEHAGGLLRTIEEGRKQDDGSTGKALNSALSVVENVQQGVVDFDKIVEDALKASLHTGISPPPMENGGAQNARAQVPATAESPMNPGIQIARKAAALVTKAHQTASGGSRLHAPEVITKLSNQMPDLFNPKAAGNVSKNWDALTPLSSMPTANSLGKTPTSTGNTTWMTNLIENWEKNIDEGTSRVGGQESRKRDAMEADLGRGGSMNIDPKRVVMDTEGQANQMVRGKLDFLQDLLTLKVQKDDAK